MIDLRSDLLGPRPPGVLAAERAAASRAAAMEYGEAPDEHALMTKLQAEFGVEAVVLVPTCTMANQIAIRLHLPKGGRLVSAALAHVVTVEARATALTGVDLDLLPHENGHLSPSSVSDFLARRRSGDAALVWLENTQMLAGGLVMPRGWQPEIASICRPACVAVHLDGSRLWNAAVMQDAPMSSLIAGCDTAAVSLNKAIGAPLGSVLCGSRLAIDEAVRWRDALGGGWRPLGGVAAAALAALEGWRDRLAIDAAITLTLADALAVRLGEAAVQPPQTNLIFLNRPRGDAAAFVEALTRHGVRTISLSRTLVRAAIHSGVREREVAAITAAIGAAAAELAAEPDLLGPRPTPPPPRATAVEKTD